MLAKACTIKEIMSQHEFKDEHTLKGKHITHRLMRLLPILRQLIRIESSLYHSCQIVRQCKPHVHISPFDLLHASNDCLSITNRYTPIMIDVMFHRTLIALISHGESSLHRRKLGGCPVLVMMAFGKVRSRVTWFLGDLLFLESVGGNCSVCRNLDRF
jgi:hypothetical protein